MESEPTEIPPFDALIEADDQNFKTTTRALGTTAELVQDLKAGTKALRISCRFQRGWQARGPHAEVR